MSSQSHSQSQLVELKKNLIYNSPHTSNDNTDTNMNNNPVQCPKIKKYKKSKTQHLSCISCVCGKQFKAKESASHKRRFHKFSKKRSKRNITRGDRHINKMYARHLKYCPQGRAYEALQKRDGVEKTTTQEEIMYGEGMRKEISHTYQFNEEGALTFENIASRTGGLTKEELTFLWYSQEPKNDEGLQKYIKRLDMWENLALILRQTFLEFHRLKDYVRQQKWSEEEKTDYMYNEVGKSVASIRINTKGETEMNPFTSCLIKVYIDRMVCCSLDGETEYHTFEGFGWFNQDYIFKKFLHHKSLDKGDNPLMGLGKEVEQ